MTGSLLARCPRAVRRLVHGWTVRWGRPFGRADLPRAAVVLLSYKRPQNLEAIVRLCLAARFVDRVVVSNSNPDYRIGEWIATRSDRLTLVDQPRHRPPGSRFEVARGLDAEHYLALDDDLFLFPSQLSRLYERYLAEPEVPHGFWGQRLRRVDGRAELGHVKGDGGRADVLNRGYCFSRAHVDEFFRLLDALGVDSVDGLRRGDDLVLSFAGPRPPVVHDLGPILDCPTSGHFGIALWREPGFAEARLELFSRLRALKPGRG